MFLGFFLGPIGVLIALALSDKRPHQAAALPAVASASSAASHPRPPHPNPPASVAAPATAGAQTGELERLGSLFERGLLTADEFAQAKAQVLKVPSSPTTPARVAPGAPAAASPSAAGVSGRTAAAAGAGIVGGMLLSNVAAADAATSEPTTEHMEYQETFTGPDGETMVIDGSMDSTVSYDESGDMHVEIQDEGTMTMGGETFDYSSEIDSDIDISAAADDGGGFFDSLGDLFG
jgi:Short C-terminal domain